MKKISILIASLVAVLALGLANAQDFAGKYIDYAIVMPAGQSSVTVKAGETTYIQMTQDPANWGIDPASSNFEVYVDDDGYAPLPTKSLEDWFWVLDEDTPANWAVFVPKSESTLAGKVQNVYGIRIPAGTAPGTYNLKLHVRYNNSGEVFTFPLNVTVAG